MIGQLFLLCHMGAPVPEIIMLLQIMMIPETGVRQNEYAD